MAKKRYWRVIGYDSTNQIYERQFPLGIMPQNQMAAALRSLVASAGLTFDEILDCHTRKNAKIHRELLEVRTESQPHFSMTCGLNPHFIASVVEK
ncbi:hypothetical protein EZJ19_11020 [Parasulfuritortus cantonensis]|uniref:Uncharacterized protein n=1 Tax=Parasulfuritortus cantonensis TaxID=2528202 RepID=A0A4V2NVB1_9PROT|nr:hypothetical protein [Parasulfuritortus cantonensis]TCJ12766.1 hypothetical protein EZJ19_11020 [Parasulfuritortus cantonensis]